MKKANIGLSLGLLAVIIVEIVGLFRAGASLATALFVVWPTIYIYCKIFKLDYSAAEKSGYDALRKGMQTLMIMVAVGALVGSWIQAGTIPSMIYFGLKLINPSVFLLCCLIITSIMSVATGTAYGSAASAGIAMMGIGIAMGVPAGLTAGAVLCGATFGDKISPLSDTTNICPALTGGDLFKHIKSMLWTTVPSYLLCVVLFTILGFKYGGAGADLTAAQEVMTVLNSNFKISLIACIPVIVVIVLLIFRVDALPAIEVGAIVGVFVAFLYQGAPFMNCINGLYNGFSIDSGNAIVDKLLNRGGIGSMASTIFIMMFAIGLGGMLQGLGVLEALLTPLTKKIRSIKSLVGVTMLVSYISNMIGCSVAVSHVITGNIMGPIYKEKNVAPEVCSRTMEDCATCGGVLIPWHGNAAYYTGVLGVTFAEYFPYLFLGFLTPVFALICAFTGLGISYLSDEGFKNTENKEEKVA